MLQPAEPSGQGCPQDPLRQAAFDQGREPPGTVEEEGSLSINTSETPEVPCGGKRTLRWSSCSQRGQQTQPHWQTRTQTLTRTSLGVSDPGPSPKHPGAALRVTFQARRLGPLATVEGAPGPSSKDPCHKTPTMPSLYPNRSSAENTMYSKTYCGIPCISLLAPLCLN